MPENIVGRGLLIAVGVAHLGPASAVLSRHRLEKTYGVTADDADVELLLRHRATFFGLTGAGLIAAAYVPSHRTPMIGAAIISLGSFVVLGRSLGSTNPRLQNLERVDVGLIAALMASAVLSRRSESA